MYLILIIFRSRPLTNTHQKPPVLTGNIILVQFKFDSAPLTVTLTVTVTVIDYCGIIFVRGNKMFVDFEIMSRTSNILTIIVPHE